MTEKAPEPTIGDLMAELRRMADAMEQGPREPAILTTEELQAVTGYKIASRQLKTLHRLGFSRARIGMGGRIILERYHYQAVCAGLYEAERPRLPPVDPLRPRRGIDVSKIR